MDVIEVETATSQLNKEREDPQVPVHTNCDSVEKTYAYFLPCEKSQVWCPREIFPENIAFIDKKKKFCRERKSQELSYPKSLDAEFIKDPQLCEEVFQLSLYQTILYGSSNIHTRFTKGYTDLSFQTKINKITVTEELKKFMSAVSIKCSQILRDVGLLCDYIELDAEKDFFVMAQGSMINVRISVNVLSLSEEPQPWQTAKSDSEEEQDDVRDYGYLKISSKSTRDNQRKKMSIDKTSVSKNKEQNYKDPSTINVMLSFRNWIPAKEVFLKYMIGLANTNHNTYLLVCHLGPLVEIPRITLYQYMMSSQVRKLCKNQKEEKSAGEENELKMEAHGEFIYKDSSDEESNDSSPEIAVVETTDFKFVTEKKEEDAKRIHKKVQIGGHTICETPVPSQDYMQPIVIPVESESSDEEEEPTANVESTEAQVNEHRKRNDDYFHNKMDANEERVSNSNSSSDEKVHETVNNGADEGIDSCSGSMDQSQLLKLTMEEIWQHWSRNEGQYVYAETKLKECLRNYIYDLPPLPRRVPRRVKKKTEKK